MITHFRFDLTFPEGAQPNASWGYWFYAALLEQLSPENAEYCHQEGASPVSQHLRLFPREGRLSWHVTLQGNEAERLLTSEIEALRTIHVRSCVRPVELHLADVQRLTDLDAVLERAAAMPDSTSHRLVIYTPASFKSAGRYVIFPEVRQIIQNLALRWSVVAPQYPLCDEDAWQMMAEQIWIRDYRLRTDRFELKGSRIPGFSGTIWLQNKLPAPLMELWKLLLVYADFCGIGIKTSLGMGGAHVVMEKTT